MTDRNNQELRVGDVCVYLGGKKRALDADDYIGKKVTVRSIKDIASGGQGERARVDDGKPEDPEMETNEYSWAAWVTGDELAKV